MNFKKKNIIQNRAAARMGLELQAERMLRSSRQKFTPAKPGDTVRIRVPDVDRGRIWIHRTYWKLS